MQFIFLCACAAAAASASAVQEEDPYESPSGALPRAAPGCGAASTWGPNPCAYASGMVLSSTTPWRASGSQPAVVHGLAQPSETLTLSGLPPGASVSPSNPWTADAAGRWAVTLASADTSAPVNLTFTGSSGKLVVLEDVLFGLTMLCSGQVRWVLSRGRQGRTLPSLSHTHTHPPTHTHAHIPLPLSRVTWT
jgi:hypothetical protein